MKGWRDVGAAAGTADGSQAMAGEIVNRNVRVVGLGVRLKLGRDHVLDVPSSLTSTLEGSENNTQTIAVKVVHGHREG